MGRANRTHSIKGIMYFKFFTSLLKHKWYVFLAGLKTGVPVWRLIVHDWQKFTGWEFGRYARHFHAPKRDIKPDDELTWPDKNEPDVFEFAYAWLHHENTAPHHWGYWIPRSGRYDGKPLPMPETYIREMVADWMGASKAYTKSWDMSDWLSNNGPGMGKKMHPDTVDMVHKILLDLGYFFTDNAPWICQLKVKQPKYEEL